MSSVCCKVKSCLTALNLCQPGKSYHDEGEWAPVKNKVVEVDQREGGVQPAGQHCAEQMPKQ